MVDGIKCCGQVEQGEDRQVAVIDSIQNVRQCRCDILAIFVPSTTPGLTRLFSAHSLIVL